jgi:hypothetical protein
MEIIHACFVIYPKKDQEYGGEADGKARKVEERKPAILYQVAPCNFPAIFEHDVLFFQRTKCFSGRCTQAKEKVTINQANKCNPEAYTCRCKSELIL